MSDERLFDSGAVVLSRPHLGARFTNSLVAGVTKFQFFCYNWPRERRLVVFWAYVWH